MRNYISEDDIERAIIDKLKSEELNYNVILCDPNPNKKENLNDGTMRSDKHQCVLPQVLRESLYAINSHLPQEKIDEVVKDFVGDFSNTDIVATNYNLYNKIRNNIKISIRKDGKEDFDFLKVIDFENPLNNTFTAVSQMWIQGRYGWRRPDILIFVNGLPLVFIELKNSPVKVEEAYNKNLKDYIKDIPNLFAFNQICVLSNGTETRLGAFNAAYDYFFEWLKVSSEKEQVDRKSIKEQGLSINYFIDGLLNKANLIDYIENFIMFQNQSIKIIAKNHQYLGVNNLFENTKNRKELKGKLGVFWHTQGSGKSYSMVMYVRKLKKKMQGNFTFLVVTDRENLDGQIYKNFLRTEVIGNKEDCQPKNSEQLRDYLTKNKSIIFTLIQKFRYDKTKKFPVLSTIDDIIVLVDEAHRTQYKDLAENMRAGLPNANFIAFTGTPLLGAKKLTNQWFGDYASEYNFTQSVEDGSTVPLFYSKRVPCVELENNYLDDDILDIIESENLNEAEELLLENSKSKILEVIKRDDRLETVAKDIAYHFPRRGFLGKGMVVAVDKFTAVRLYDKVTHYWNEEKKSITLERNSASTKEERDKLTHILDYMNNVEMAVVISDSDDDEKFIKEGLNIEPHRKKMNEISTEGLDIEDRFSDPKDKLQLVFVCAMWLTGTDVPCMSTLYLDKPMKSHTLMQAIARANRVFKGKPCGIIVDYVNVFKYMKQALAEYAIGDDNGEYPAKDVDKLLILLDNAIEEANTLIKSIGYDLTGLFNEHSVLDKLDVLRKVYNDIVGKDDLREKFKVISNTMINLYEASKPEVFEKGWENENFAPISYIHGLFHNYIDDEKINRAKLRMSQVLDSSVVSNSSLLENQEMVIKEGKVIDLSKIDASELRKEIKQAEYKQIEIEDLKAFIQKTLEQMINRNFTRIKFSERFKGIIDRYNAGGTENEEYFEQLVKLIESLKKESVRHTLEGLSEEELEIYDLLIKDKKLTVAEEQKVKLASKNLYKKLTESKTELMVVDWFKDDQPKEKVLTLIKDSLDSDLPDSYDKICFMEKSSQLLNHFIDMSIQNQGWIRTAG